MGREFRQVQQRLQRGVQVQERADQASRLRGANRVEDVIPCLLGAIESKLNESAHQTRFDGEPAVTCLLDLLQRSPGERVRLRDRGLGALREKSPDVGGLGQIEAEHVQGRSQLGGGGPARGFGRSALP